MITADQILAHLVGDYILQSDWMAENKTKNLFPAAVHAFTYTLPFILLTTSINALLFISITHFLIDRFRLARWIIWSKNGYIFRGKPTNTGYLDDKPPWLSVWLLIITDNTLHLICNGLAFMI